MMAPSTIMSRAGVNSVSRHASVAMPAGIHCLTMLPIYVTVLAGKSCKCCQSHSYDDDGQERSKEPILQFEKNCVACSIGHLRSGTKQLFADGQVLNRRVERPDSIRIGRSGQLVQLPSLSRVDDQ